MGGGEGSREPSLVGISQSAAAAYKTKIEHRVESDPKPIFQPLFPHSNRSYLTKSRQPGLRIQDEAPIYAPKPEDADGAASPRAPAEWPITSSGPL